MSGAQAQTNHLSQPFHRGSPMSLSAAVLAQDAARTLPLKPYTFLGQNQTTRKFNALVDTDPVLTPGKLVCGTFGSTAKAMAAISNGSFGVPIDGETAIALSGLDFRKIKNVGDTRAKAVCGALGTVTLATWQGLTNHGFGIPINGTTIDITGLNFSGIAAIPEIPDVINAAAAGRFFCTYDATTHVLTFFSPTLGADSTIGALIVPSTGTDISGSGYLNGASASLTQGTGSDGTGLTMIDVINSAAAGRFVAEWDGSKVTILSPTRGVYSAVGALTVGATGTDISGASYLNGAGTAGTATAGTGDDGSERPIGIYVGPELTAAAIVAGDVNLDCVYLSIPDGYFDESLAVFDAAGSVTMNSIVTTTGLTVRNELMNRGLRPQTTLVTNKVIGA